MYNLLIYIQLTYIYVKQSKNSKIWNRRSKNKYMNITRNINITWNYAKSIPLILSLWMLIISKEYSIIYS